MYIVFRIEFGFFFPEDFGRPIYGKIPDVVREFVFWRAQIEYFIPKYAFLFKYWNQPTTE